MTARAVYVCRDCIKVFVADDVTKEAEDIAERNARAHQDTTGHQTVLQRPKMPWEIA